MTDLVRVLLDEHGDAAVELSGKLRKLVKEGRISDEVIAIATSLEDAAQAAVERERQRCAAHVRSCAISYMDDDEFSGSLQTILSGIEKAKPCY